MVGLFLLLYWRVPGSEESGPSAVEVSGPAFGTTYSVKYVGPESAAGAVQSVVESVVDAVNRSMSTYDPDSELSRLNRLETTASVTVSARLAVVLDEAFRIHRLTDGAFDPTVGPVVDAWGFGPTKPVEPPTPEELEAARAKVGLERLAREEGAVRKTVPGLRLDLSGIAKGYAVAEVSRRLQAEGIAHHLVEIGGELQAHGRGTNGAWRVGIERPQSGPSQEVLEVVALRDAALATSGNYRNFRTVEGRTVTHIIDPRTGEPVGHGLGSVSVVHSDCTTADALATALYVLGEADGLAWAESHDVAAVFLTPTEHGVRRRATAVYEALAARTPDP